VKEAKPTDKEFETAWTLMAEMAKFTGDERNEFLLFCDVTGVSQLIEMINHARPRSAVGFILVGPFFRANAPMRKRGESIASDDTKSDRAISPANFGVLPILLLSSGRSESKPIRSSSERPPRFAKARSACGMRWESKLAHVTATLRKAC
jgi:hypothetical protein